MSQRGTSFRPGRTPCDDVSHDDRISLEELHQIADRANIGHESTSHLIDQTGLDDALEEANIPGGWDEGTTSLGWLKENGHLRYCHGVCFYVSHVLDEVGIGRST